MVIDRIIGKKKALEGDGSMSAFSDAASVCKAELKNPVICLLENLANTRIFWFEYRKQSQCLQLDGVISEEPGSRPLAADQSDTCFSIRISGVEHEPFDVILMIENPFR